MGETNVPQFRNTRNACEIVHGVVGRVFLNTMRISLKVPLAHQRAPSISRVRGEGTERSPRPPVATGKGEMNQGARMAVVEGTRGGAEREARTKIAGPNEGRWGE